MSVVELFPATGIPLCAERASFDKPLGKESRYIPIPSDSIPYPQTTLDAFEKLRSLGFLTEPENKIVCGKMAYPGAPLPEVSPHTYTHFRLSFPEVYHSISQFRVNLRTDLANANSVGRTGLEHKFSTVEKLFESRFDGYEFTPVNGWGHMYYLDYITNWSRSWSDSEIKIIDDYKSEGYSMNAIAALLRANVPVRGMTDMIGLPASWLERAFV